MPEPETLLKCAKTKGKTIVSNSPLLISLLRPDFILYHTLLSQQTKPLRIRTRAGFQCFCCHLARVNKAALLRKTTPRAIELNGHQYIHREDARVIKQASKANASGETIYIHPHTHTHSVTTTPQFRLGK